MTKSLTHLESFCSDDAKRGRVWTDGEYTFRRKGDWLFRSYETRGRTFEEEISAQVAVMEGEVRWTDEPKTLTPQEALRALADGECLQDDDVTVWVGFDGTFRGPNKDGVDGPVTIHRLGGFRIAPAHETDPSQPPEPVEPTFKVDDRVQVVSSSMKGGCAGDNVGLAGVVCFVAETGEVRVMFDDDSSSWYKPSDLKHLPAEPRRDWNPLGKYEDMPPDIQADIKSERGWAKHEPVKPPLKVGDRVKMGNSRGSVVWSGSERVHVEFDGVGVPTAHDLVDIEKIEAEPETPAPSFKAGDRVRVVRNSFGACDNTVGALGTVLRFNSTSDIDVRSDLDGISWCFDETDLVLIEAEPQVKYPLSFAEAMWAMECGSHVSSERWPGNVYHKDYSFLAFDTDEVKSSWRIVEPATGGEG